jgi:hypothetical protein
MHLPFQDGDAGAHDGVIRKTWSPWSKVLMVSLLILFAVLGGVLGYLAWRYRVPPLPSRRERNPLPVPWMEKVVIHLSMPNGNLLALVGVYSDELTAFMRFQYLQGLSPLAGSPILMVNREETTGPQYRLYVILQNDLFPQNEKMASLQISGYFSRYQFLSPPSFQIDQWRTQTRLFAAAYDRPVRKRLLQLPREELTSAVAKFILFKVRTDRRVREQIEPELNKPLTPGDASDFAADMIDVAQFYGIPLDMLLGIGAMENNYLDVRGDLTHAIWKRHAQRGDIILKRRHGRVLVSDFSVGPWQFTRETLRYVHGLYLHDHRDYTQLPERLRPPRRLDLDHVDSDILTTYAGLLLRKLLDDFHGDQAKAEGAYNGGVGEPNLQYSEGVSLVANYARRILNMAAARSGESIKQSKLKVVNSRAEKEAPDPQAVAAGHLGEASVAPDSPR